MNGGTGGVKRWWRWVVAAWSGGLVAMSLSTLLWETSVDLDPFLVPASLMVGAGAFLAIRVAGNPVGPVLLICGSAWLTYVTSQAWAAASIETGSALLGEYLLAWAGSWIGALMPLSLAALFVVFPDGDITGLRRWFLGFLAFACGWLLVGAARLWGTPVELLIDFDALDTIDAYGPVDQVWVIGFFSVAPAVISLVLRYRTSETVKKLQIKWLIASGALFVASFFVGAILFEDSPMWGILLAVSMSLMVAAIGVSVIRYRLFEIDRIISRTLSYTVVVVLLGGLFFGLVTLVTSLLPTQGSLAVAGATLAVAALFNPARKRIQHAVDRRFNRSRYQAETLSDQFADKLREPLSSHQITSLWSQTVEEAVQPQAVGIWLTEPAIRPRGRT